jgi:hypothetical protein
MFVDTSVLDLIHLVQLSLEDNEVFGWSCLSIKETFLEFLESVNYFEEISLLQKEFVISSLSFLKDCLNWEEKCVFFKILIKTISLVFL